MANPNRTWARWFSLQNYKATKKKRSFHAKKMNTIYKIVVSVLTVIACISTLGCRRSNEPPPQFDPPPGIFPSKVGKLAPEEKFKPKCIRDVATKCASAYADPAGDADLTRIYYSVDIFDKPDHAVARLEELGRERVMDEDQFVWEDRPNNAGKLLVRSGFRRTDDGMTIGSCTVAFTKESKLFEIASSWDCESARGFVKDLTAIID